MPDRKPDRRIARSRGLILDAFGSLMLERGYERMTVQHVLDRAGVDEGLGSRDFASAGDDARGGEKGHEDSAAHH